MRKPTVVVAVAVAFFVSVQLSFAQTGRLWTPLKPGIWSVRGTDEQNVRWTARMHLERRGIRKTTVLYSGYFYWRSPDVDTKGYEYFTGSLDRRAGVLKLHGKRVRNLQGELGVGVYRAQVRRSSEIYNGKWSDGDSVPGNWTARWSQYH